MSLADAMALENKNTKPELFVEIADVNLLQLNEDDEDSFQFVQTSEESGLYMKKPTEDSFIQYNQFKKEKLKETFKAA